MGEDGPVVLKVPVKFRFIDLLLLLLLSAGAGYVLYRMTIVNHYKWDWAGAVSYVIRFDRTDGGFSPGLLLRGLWMTVKLSLWASVFASAIGLAAGLMRISERLSLKWLSFLYVGIVRNMPSIVFIFIFYFFISSQISLVFGLDDFFAGLSRYDTVLDIFLSSSSMLTVFFSAVLTLAIYEGAYMAEIVRAGIQSVERGQGEAADALGFTWWNKMRHIILPQAFKRILPPMAGQVISIIKDSAIVSVISVQELTFRGTELMASSYRTYEIWILITLMYFILTYGCSFAVRRVEVSMERRGYV